MDKNKKEIADNLKALFEENILDYKFTVINSLEDLEKFQQEQEDLKKAEEFWSDPNINFEE